MTMLVAQADTMGGISMADALTFIWHEAELLDRLDYLPWLELWAQDGHYVVPIDRNDVPFADRVNMAYDDAPMREARVRRLRSGLSMSSAPPARTIRTVSRFVAAAATDDSLTVRTAQHIVEFKYGRTLLLAADVTYQLIRDGEGLKLFDKIVQLIDSDDAQHGMGYLL